jgi:hypothetical protein
MDVFLSYNRADAAAAATLDAWLRDQGLSVFLDTRELRAGEAWLPELERAVMQEAQAVAVLVGPSGLGNTQHYEHQLALVRQAREPGFPVIPVLLPGTPEWRFPRGFLELQTWVDFAEGLSRPDALLRLLAAIRREPLDAEAVRGAICPYKGLEAFQEEDARIFFGRAAEAAQLHRTVIEHGVAAVIGRSGSGKSSLARAGLLPLLRRKAGEAWGTVWDRMVLRPGRYPLSALAEALDPPQAPRESIEYGAALRRTADLLRGEKPDFVAELLHRRLAGLDRRTDRFLILLDQAEEMFARPIELTDAQALRDWQADTESLIALLLGAAQRGPASLVLTIRSDFFDPLQHSPMGPLLNKAMVATRGVQDLRAAVAGPAALVGLRFSPGLEDRILRETGEDEGNLPLLQHALKRSWALREGGVITSAAYDRSGGVEQAINLAAQSAYDALGTEGQAAAKRLFLRLVRPGEGRGHVRVRAPLPEEGAQRVVAEFFGAPERRLLFFGQVDGRNTMEVAHEALIRGWPKLLEWVEENRERLATRDAVQDWIASSGGELLPASILLSRAKALLADPGEVDLGAIRQMISHSARRQVLRRMVGAGLAGSMLAGVSLAAPEFLKAREVNSARKAEANRQDITGRAVVFSCQVGKGAFDLSPFTTALVEHLSRSEINLGEAVRRASEITRAATKNRQIPEVTTSLNGEIYLGEKHPDRRIEALVVGNGQPVFGASMPGAIADANRFTLGLRRLGITSTLLHDASAELILSEARKLCAVNAASLQPPYRLASLAPLSPEIPLAIPVENSLAIFYFAGTGINVGGQDAIIAPGRQNIELNALTPEKILASEAVLLIDSPEIGVIPILSRQAAATICVFDSCRYSIGQR